MQRGTLDIFYSGICQNTSWCDGVVGGVRWGPLPTESCGFIQSCCRPKLDCVNAVWRSRWWFHSWKERRAQPNLVTIMATFKSCFKTRCIDGYRPHFRTEGLHPTLQLVADVLSTFSTHEPDSPKGPINPTADIPPCCTPHHFVCHHYPVWHQTHPSLLPASPPPKSTPPPPPDLSPCIPLLYPTSPSLLPPSLTQRTKAHCLPVTIRCGAQ